MPQSDYLLRLLEQAAQLLRQITLQRGAGAPDSAIQSVIDGTERLFGLKVTELWSLDSEELYSQLTREENPRDARDKCLVFAALAYQAGLAYADKDLPALSQPAFHLALVFTLLALARFPGADLPQFTPSVDDLLSRLDGFALPESTAELLADYKAAR